MTWTYDPNGGCWRDGHRWYATSLVTTSAQYVLCLQCGARKAAP